MKLKVSASHALLLLLLATVTAMAGLKATLKLNAVLQATVEGKAVKASGRIDWQLIDQATITSGRLRAQVPDGTVWEIYMRVSPLSLEPIYVGQATFTGGRAQFAVCSGDAQAGYYLIVFDDAFTTMLEGTLE